MSHEQPDTRAAPPTGPTPGNSLPPASPPMSPGDEAPPDTPGTGEAPCPACGGSGRDRQGQPCSNCEGSGRITAGIGGA